VIDRQTNGQRDGRTIAYSALSIGLYAYMLSRANKMNDIARKAVG